MSQPIHLCIGAPRAGTTWLFNNLKDADCVFTPIVKEVGYWHGGPSQSEKNRMATDARAADESIDAIQNDWLERWLAAQDVSGETYRHLMSRPDVPSIDISPSYSIMSEGLIKQVYETLPRSSKVLYILRNPYERISSQFRLHAYLHGRFRGPVSDGTLLDAIKSHPQCAWQDYRTTALRWRTVFGDRLKLMYYDDLVRDPVTFLKSIVDFLQIELPNDDLTAKKAGGYFGTDRNQRDASILPNITPSQKAIIASYALKFAEDFQSVNKDVANNWIKDIRSRIMPKADFTPTPCEVNPRYERLLRMSESLGDNCEFGFFQRSEGYEPSSLFRWSVTPADKLLSYLKNPKPLFLKENLATTNSDLVLDLGSGFHFHSSLTKRSESERALLAVSEDFDEVYQKEKSKIDWLEKKFWTFIRTRPALYVIKANDGLKDELLLEIARTLRSFNDRHLLLCVEANDKAFIQRRQPGVYRASVSSLADYSAADKIETYSWKRIFHQLTDEDEIRGLIDRMFV